MLKELLSWVNVNDRVSSIFRCNNPVLSLGVIILFDNCNLNESSLIETNLKNIEFNNCNLNKSEIFNTSLKDIDLSSCDIHSIIIDNNSIKGLIIDSSQAIDLINMLEVKIK